MRSRHLRGNIFVANLPPDFSDERLAEIFDSFGIVLSAFVARDPTSGKRLRHGFVDIATERAAQRAVSEMNGVAIDGYQIEVQVSERKPPPQKPAPPPPAAPFLKLPPAPIATGLQAIGPPPRGAGRGPGAVLAEASSQRDLAPDLHKVLRRQVEQIDGPHRVPPQKGEQQQAQPREPPVRLAGDHGVVLAEVNGVVGIKRAAESL